MKSADKTEYWYFEIKKIKSTEEPWPTIYSYAGSIILQYLQFNDTIRVYRTPVPHMVKKLMIQVNKEFVLQIPDEFHTEIYSQNFSSREPEVWLTKTRRMPAPKKYPSEHLED